MIRLEKRLIDKLLAQSESGMGYQFVDVDESNGVRQSGIAYNAELVVLDEESSRIAKLAPALFTNMAKAARTSVNLITDIHVRASPTRASTAVFEKAAGPGTEAKDAPRELTALGDVFKRFSAFENDRRVLPDRSLLPGTYATTEDDARHVHSGSEAVSRYALPNPEPASWVFTCKPHEKTPVQRGIVAPAYGQPGRGVEVIFPEGTQAGTTPAPLKIPD